MKQSSLDDHDSLNMDVEAGMMHDGNDELVELSEYDERRFEPGETGQQYNYEHRPSTSTPVPMPVLRGAHLNNYLIVIYQSNCLFIQDYHGNQKLDKKTSISS